MNRPWPSGPDGQPLPADQAGEPVWPSEQYRRDYEQALAQRAATIDQRRRSQRTPILVIIVLLVVAFASWQLYEYTQAPKKAQQDVCQVYQDTGVTPPPGQECP